ncbi:hypothetical protein [Clostridium taeniosporum]|uniref:Uncharacterized protein n=1 Tax=Clostridium taeniosporum TaxID=394958 RepID=A0A1D7XIE1_9CLOT|nr:hypothetical protein [Clostridium taeniosporum]AOR23105.1 hypothetical protein BGI42_04930 [Clostridium taeniosporum]
MKKDIFTITEVIAIVMDLADKLKVYELYGFEDESELHITRHLNDKLESLYSVEYDDFLCRCSEIAEDILSIKTGELNELNQCHEEIGFLAKKKLKEFLIDI